MESTRDSNVDDFAVCRLDRFPEVVAYTISGGLRSKTCPENAGFTDLGFAFDFALDFALDFVVVFDQIR